MMEYLLNLFIVVATVVFMAGLIKASIAAVVMIITGGPLAVMLGLFILWVLLIVVTAFDE